MSYLAEAIKKHNQVYANLEKLYEENQSIYLKRVEGLFNQVISWLEKPAAERLLTYRIEPITFSEKDFPQIEGSKLVIVVDGNEMRLKPDGYFDHRDENNLGYIYIEPINENAFTSLQRVTLVFRKEENKWLIQDKNRLDILSEPNYRDFNEIIFTKILLLQTT